MYEIRNLVSGLVYVGSSIRPDARWRAHQCVLRKGLHHSPTLQRSWAKHGSEAFQFTILEILNVTEGLREREQVWMDRLNAACPLRGFNVLPRAGTSAGRSFSAAVIARMSASQIGKVLSLSTRRLISAALVGRPRPESVRRAIGLGRKGKLMPEAYLEKRRGQLHTEVSKEKMRLSALGRTVTEETRKKISEKLTGRRVVGRKRSPMTAECKAKISAANRAAHARKVRHIEDSLQCQ